MLNAWDQFVWPPSLAVPRAATQVEQYGYCCGNAVDLSTVMPATEFRVTDEEGAYLCMARALIFEGSILAYNLARDEAEWVLACRVANDLSWVEERIAVALVNFVPHTPQEVHHIMELRTCHLLAWTDSSSLEEEGEQMQEEEGEQTQEEGDEPEEDECEEVEGSEESNPEALPSDEMPGQGEAEPQ